MKQQVILARRSVRAVQRCPRTAAKLIPLNMATRADSHLVLLPQFLRRLLPEAESVSKAKLLDLELRNSRSRLISTILIIIWSSSWPTQLESQMISKQRCTRHPIRLVQRQASSHQQLQPLQMVLLMTMARRIRVEPLRVARAQQLTPTTHAFRNRNHVKTTRPLN